MSRTPGWQFRDVGRQHGVLEQVVTIQESKNADPVLGFVIDTLWGLVLRYQLF